MNDYLRVGVISSTHGVRGEVKVFPTTDDIKRFKQLENIILDRKNQKTTVEIENVRFFKQMVILKLKGVDDMDEAAKYKGTDLLIAREDALPLAEGEYYICDLIGCLVFSEDKRKLGEITEVLSTGANDVYVVGTDDGKEILLPVIPDCIKKVDIESRCITVHLMDGLLSE